MPPLRLAPPLAVMLSLVVGACRSARTALPVEPGIGFAAHRTASGFIVDQTREGATGRLEPRGRLHQPDAPDLILVVGDDPRAGLWIVGQTRILVRDGSSTRTPRTGEVLSRWDAGAIRLTLYPRAGGPLETDTFRRQGVGGDRLLTRGGEAPSGAYRATVREIGGADVGWLR